MKGDGISETTGTVISGRSVVDVADTGTDSQLDNDRQTLFDAAARIVQGRMDAEGSTAVALLSVSWLDENEVATEAGFDASVFRELWPEPTLPDGTEVSSFEAFLFDTFGIHRGPIIQDHTARAIEKHVGDLEELIRTGAAHQRLDDGDWLDNLMAVAFSSFATHERPDYKLFFDEVEVVDQMIVYEHGLEMKAPFTSRDLAMALAVVLEAPWFRRIYGLEELNPTVRYRATPQSDTKDWTLDGIAAWHIVEAMTQPRRAASGNQNALTDSPEVRS